MWPDPVFCNVEAVWICILTLNRPQYNAATCIDVDLVFDYYHCEVAVLQHMKAFPCCVTFHEKCSQPSLYNVYSKLLSILICFCPGVVKQPLHFSCWKKVPNSRVLFHSFDGRYLNWLFDSHSSNLNMIASNLSIIQQTDLSGFHSHLTIVIQFLSTITQDLSKHNFLLPRYEWNAPTHSNLM